MNPYTRRSEIKRERKRKSKRKILYSFLLILFVITVGTGVFAYTMFSDVTSAVEKMHKPISREVSEKREEEVEFHRKDPLSFLLVGVDERDGDAGRTDSMLVITINPDLKSTKIVSIPRDTRTLIVDKVEPRNSWLDKINHAYAYGGIEMSINTVEHFLNIPIDYYTEVNMHGFKEIVDAVGGIYVNNQYPFELDGVTLEVGEQHLNGRESLSYARMRKEDPRGDFGRQERQREVLSKVIKKAATFSTLTNYEDILTALEGNIKTNLTLNDIIGIQAKYKTAADSIEKVEIAGDGKIIKEIWYHMVSNETRQDISNQLREHLGLPADTVENIYPY